MPDIQKCVIGIDARPLQNTNRSGIPTYVACLIKSLLRIDTNNSYRLFFKGFPNISSCLHEISNTKLENGVFRLPNKLITRIWDTFNFPPIETFLGEIDVFHATHFLIPPVKSAKVIVTIHDLSFIKFPEYFKKAQGAEFTRKVRLSCEKAEMIISDSWSTKRDIIEIFNIPSKKISVVPLAAKEMFNCKLESTNCSFILNKYNINSRYLIYVGTIEPRKNLQRLIQAYDRLPSDIKKEYQLIFAGGKGWLDKEIYAEAEKLGLMDKGIKFLGYVPDTDLPALVKNATVFIYPSLYEGFGLPVLEAMTAGVPVITSNVSSLPEVVGDAGILVNPYSVEEISEAIQRVILDRELAIRMSERGLVRAGQFSWEKTARDTLEVYQKVGMNR